jgi:hypothetical protein
VSLAAAIALGIWIARPKPSVPQPSRSAAEDRITPAPRAPSAETDAKMKSQAAAQIGGRRRRGRPAVLKKRAFAMPSSSAIAASNSAETAPAPSPSGAPTTLSSVDAGAGAGVSSAPAPLSGRALVMADTVQAWSHVPSPALMRAVRPPGKIDWKPVIAAAAGQFADLGTTEMFVLGHGQSASHAGPCVEGNARFGPHPNQAALIGTKVALVAGLALLNKATVRQPRPVQWIVKGVTYYAAAAGTAAGVWNLQHCGG